LHWESLLIAKIHIIYGELINRLPYGQKDILKEVHKKSEEEYYKKFQ